MIFISCFAGYQYLKKDLAPAKSSVQLISSTQLSEPLFIQGLEKLDETHLAYSSGLYGASTIGTINHKTGTVTKNMQLPDHVFAEGLTQVGAQWWQGTWKENKIYQYPANFFANKAASTISTNNLKIIAYPGDFWGICADNISGTVYISNGSDKLLKYDKNLNKKGEISVGIKNLNELECANGKIYANIWLTNKIIALDPKSETVTNTWDLTDLAEQISDENGVKNPDAVLNGIAHSTDNLFYITGKLWKKIYLVKLLN
ncbi:glutaminyl-peptide cyclotransferase [Arcanobacterium hippocoleae]|uniref:glutaminyl-peptide cyclotransferase n=1 Tax=Arcanobacterium hippocoleae TaxID=149017 RepID=UPI0036069438